MFKIDFLVDDKHLASVLVGLSGKARDLHVVPVTNAEPAPNGQVKAKHDGLAFEQFVAEIRKRKLASFVASDVKAIAKHLGYAETSYFHLIGGALEAKLIHKQSKAGNGFRYALTPEKK